MVFSFSVTVASTLHNIKRPHFFANTLCFPDSLCCVIATFLLTTPKHGYIFTPFVGTQQCRCILTTSVCQRIKAVERASDDIARGVQYGSNDDDSHPGDGKPQFPGNPGNQSAKSTHGIHARVSGSGYRLCLLILWWRRYTMPRPRARWIAGTFGRKAQCSGKSVFGQGIHYRRLPPGRTLLHARTGRRSGYLTDREKAA